MTEADGLLAREVFDFEPSLAQDRSERASLHVTRVHGHDGSSPVWVTIGRMGSLLPSEAEPVAFERDDDLLGRQHW